jgi:hypothetical protein
MDEQGLLASVHAHLFRARLGAKDFTSESGPYSTAYPRLL